MKRALILSVSLVLAVWAAPAAMAPNSWPMSISTKGGTSIAVSLPLFGGSLLFQQSAQALCGDIDNTTAMTLVL